MAIEAGIHNVTPFIDGSVMFLHQLIFLSQSNTDQYTFWDFIDSILTSIENDPVEGDVDKKRRFMWNDLSLHKTAYVTNKIYKRPTHICFLSVNHPSYRPELALIELFLCDLTYELSRRVQSGWAINDLRMRIIEICSKIGCDGNSRILSFVAVTLIISY